MCHCHQLVPNAVLSMYRYAQDMASAGTAMTRFIGSGVTTVIVVLMMILAWTVPAAAAKSALIARIGSFALRVHFATVIVI